MATGKSTALRGINPKTRVGKSMQRSLRKLLRTQDRRAKAHQAAARKAVRSGHVAEQVEHPTKVPHAARKARSRRRNQMARASRRANR